MTGIWTIFNNHFTPFFYVLSPLVHLTRSLFFLLLLYSLAFATSAWLYYKFAKEILGSSSLAALCYLTLVVNPYFMVANLYPHYEVFMALALMGFALLAVRGNSWLALLCLVIALSVKEDVWIYGIAASLILLGRISTRHAALYLGTAVAYYVVVLHFLYPILYPDGVNLKYFLQIWAYGHSQGEVLQYLVTHPWDTGQPPHHRLRFGLQLELPFSAGSGWMALSHGSGGTLLVGQFDRYLSQ